MYGKTMTLNSEHTKTGMNSVAFSYEKRGDNFHPIASFSEMSLYEEYAPQKEVVTKRLKLLKCLLQQANGAADSLLLAIETQASPATEIYRRCEVLQQELEPLKIISADAKRIAFVFERGTRLCEIQQVSNPIPSYGECRGLKGFVTDESNPKYYGLGTAMKVTSCETLSTTEH
jgi:hypothetical protein